MQFRISKLLGLVLCASLFLGACGSRSVFEEIETTSSSFVEKEKPLKPGNTSKIIAYLELSDASFFFKALQETLRKEIEGAGFQFQVYSCGIDWEKQAEQFIRCIEEGVYCIIIDPVDSESIVTLVDDAKRRGIHVTFVDTLASGGDVDFSVTFDNYKAGRLMAERTVELLTKKYGETRGKMLNLYGRQESEATRKRVEGVEDVISKYPSIQYFSVQAGNTPEEYYKKTAEAILEHPDLDAIHVYTETFLESVVLAMKDTEKWYTSEEDGHIIFTSIDGTASALTYVSEGYLDASAAQDAVAYGQLTFKYLDDYIFKGDEIQLGEYRSEEYYWDLYQIIDDTSGIVILLPSYIIDKTNVDDSRHWANIAIQTGIKNILSKPPNENVRVNKSG